MNTNSHAVSATPAVSVAQQAIDTANNISSLSNLMTVLQIGSIMEADRTTYIMADGSAVIFEHSIGYYPSNPVDGCGGKVVQFNAHGVIVTATAAGGMAIANGTFSSAIALGRGMLAIALSNASSVTVSRGYGVVGRDGTAVSMTKAGVLRGDVGSTLRWVDEDLADGFLEITVGYGDGVALPNEDYSLGRSCNQWVITRTSR